MVWSRADVTNSKRFAKILELRTGYLRSVVTYHALGSSNRIEHLLVELDRRFRRY